jgi:citrate synthase
MPSQEEFEKEANAIGERLAMLLVAADMPDDVKDGFAAMIPEMTPEQLDRLMKILEANVHDTAAAQEAELGKAVQAAQAQYETDRQAAEKKAMAELDDIEALLKQG